MLERYLQKLPLGENKYWYRPARVTYPTETHKYIQTTWNDNYTWFRLSYMSYGTTELYWLLMGINGITNPYGVKNGDRVLVLLEEYLNEVVINERSNA